MAAVMRRSACSAAGCGGTGRVLWVAGGARTTVEGALLHTRVARHTVLPLDAADAGASVAVFAMGIRMKHPIVANEAQHVAGFLRRRHPRQRNISKDPDRRVVTLVVFVVAVLHSVVQHVEQR